MSTITLSCAETPLAWPPSVPLNGLDTCGTCGIRIIAPNAGSLQLTTRRPIGDGVNVDEHNQIGAEYRGQQYTYEEAIFHTPGLHVFPGQSAAYPAEYHIHMRSLSAPIRYITVVIPASHLVAEDSVTKAYFSVMRKEPRAAETRPNLESLMAALDSTVLQYQGPDLRGRVIDTSGSPVCASTDERQFLLVLKPAYIRASDLERIPREGSRSSDPRNLPAPGVEPKIKALPLDRLKRSAVLASPGILYAKKAATAKAGPQLRLLNGNDLVDISGTPISLDDLLGKKPGVAEPTGGVDVPVLLIVLIIASMFVRLIGFLLADWVFTRFVWPFFFEASPLLAEWNIYKWNLFIFVCVGPIVYNYLISFLI